jgi:hypothetical protein
MSSSCRIAISSSAIPSTACVAWLVQAVLVATPGARKVVFDVKGVGGISFTTAESIVLVVLLWLHL